MQPNQLIIISVSLLVSGAGIVYFFLKRKKRKFLAAEESLDNLKIHIVNTERECDNVVAELQRRCMTSRTVGFDCEWVTEHGKRRPVALVQLSTFDGYCGLFRLSQLKNMPSSLKNLLEDQSIYKVGVGPVNDARYLYVDFSALLKSTLDLRHIAVLCDRAPGGLAALSKSILNVTLDKSWRIRCSDWEAEKLSDRQIKYAAADAHVAVKIFVYLVNELSSNNKWSSQNGGKKEDIWNQLDDLCWRYADVNFKTCGTPKNESCSSKANKKTTVLKSRYPYATRKKPLYHNCFLEAPDGELLCTCDNKKAEWYVLKELADVVKSDPFTVRLRFEPSGRSVGDVGRYYQLIKENKCVVCGATNSYIRKNVVPREYRKYFPEIMKEHSSHDVVLLCVGCHQRSNMGDQIVRERLANMCGAPFASKDFNKYLEDVTCKKIRSAARALLQKQSKHVIPEARRKDLEDFLLNYYQLDELTDTILKKAAEVQVVSVENADYESHGMKVVEYFLAREGLLRLEEVWREHFLSTMRPKYMPELWSIKHNEERLRVKLQEGRLTEEELKSIGASKCL